MNVFRRKVLEDLRYWKESGMSKRKAAMVKGLRQVGKTVSVTEFARTNYENVAYIDFKRMPMAKQAFDGNLDIDRITMRLTAIFPDIRFIPGKTVIVMDEVQECSAARFSIKPFMEDGRYEIICTGSLLGIKGYNRKKKRDIPVGFEHTIRMYPMDFEEFLWAKNIPEDLLSYLHGCFEKRSKVDEPINTIMSEHFREYICVGGMPSVIRTFLEKNDMNAVRMEQIDLLEQYRDDFGKYLDEEENEVTDMEMLGRINQVFDSIPSQLSKENKKFQYSVISKNARGKSYASAIQWLVDYGLVNKSYNLSLLQMPLNGNKDESSFKVYMADTGLLIAMLDRGTSAMVLNGELQIYKGAIFENVISDILAKNSVKLYYYQKSSGLEIDFISSKNGMIELIEVKSTTGNTKSAKTVLNDPDIENLDICYKYGNYNVGFMNRILTLPSYMAPFLAAELSNE